MIHEPAQNSFGYVTFSTLIHSAAALAVVLMPQLTMLPEGNVSGEVIEITMADGPLPVGEDPTPAAVQGNDTDPMPALSDDGGADLSSEEAVVVAKAPAPKPVPEPVAQKPTVNVEPLPAPEPKAVENAEIQDLETVGFEEEVDPYEEALAEQRRIEDERDAAAAIAQAEEEALAIAQEQEAEAKRQAEAKAEQQRLAEAEEAERKRQAKADAGAKKKNEAEEAERQAQLAALKAEQEKLAAEKAAFAQKLKDDAEKARQAALADKARKELAAQLAQEKAALAEAKKAAAARAQRTNSQANAQNGSVTGNKAPSNKPIGSPQGQIRDYRDIVQLPGNRPPVYPTQSRRLKQQGEVRLTYYVQSNGTVSNVRILQSSGYAALDQEAVAAIRKYRYQPGQAGWALHPVDFQLRGPEEKAFGRLRLKK